MQNYRIKYGKMVMEMDPLCPFHLL
jgi:hypothetical protein